MSRQIALDTIHLKPTPRLAHTEYSLNYHKEYIAKKTGLDPSDPAASRKLHDLWEIDFLFGTNDGLRGNWLSLGRATDMGHAVYAADGSDRREIKECPFKSAEEVLAFDAVEEYGLPDFDEQVASYEQSFQNRQAANPNQLVTGGYYKTIVSGAIQAFGWDMLLMAAAQQDRFETVLDSFFRRTLFHVEAWAKTSLEVFIQHDDFVWSAGPFMHPDFYRRVIIPRYAQLWKPLHDAGKKVLFCSDANFMLFAEEVVEAGADGLIFEPMNDFGFMVERLGQTTCLVGSYVDCREMAFAPWETVKDQIDRTLALAPKCKGLMFATGNHLPANISDERMDQYFEYLQANWRR